MYSAGVVGFLFVFIFWSACAKPCCVSWSFDKHPDIILTHPVQQEIILVMFAEDGTPEVDDGENFVQSDNKPADGLGDKLSGEIVDSAANKGFAVVAKSDPLSANGTRTQEIPQVQQTLNTTEVVEEVGFTTEIGTNV